MNNNEKIVRELYAAGDGKTLDTKKFVSMYSSDGYMLDMATGQKFYGQEIGEWIAGLAKAFPDIHREISKIHVTDNCVIVEALMQGTHAGEMKLPKSVLPPTGKKINVPSCDVFRLEGGKITAFNCYNEISIMQQQLGNASGA